MKNKAYSLKWIIEWILAAAAITLSILMFALPEFGNGIVFFFTGILLIVYAIIRFIPLIKTTRNRWAIAVNAIEMFIDAAIGVLVIVFTARQEDMTNIYKFFPFMIGGVLYLRGLIYMVETCFFGTKTKVPYFILNLALLTLGTWVMASYKTFTPNYFRLVFSVALIISGIASVGFGIVSFNKYRAAIALVKPKKEKPIKNDKEIKEEDLVPIPGDEEKEETTIVA